MTRPELWHDSVPGMDCISRGHMLVSHTQEGAFPTSDGGVPTATWCLWCGGGVSNEYAEE